MLDGAGLVHDVVGDERAVALVVFFDGVAVRDAAQLREHHQRGESYMALATSSWSEIRPSSFSLGSKAFHSAIRSARASSSVEKYSLR